MFFVYVLRNLTSGRLYTGHTADLAQRVGQHNNGISKSTKKRGTWELVYHEKFATRSDAMRRERFFKSGQGREVLRGILSNGVGRSEAG